MEERRVIKKMLVALDNSVFAEKVMTRAVELAKVFGAKLTGLSVVDHSALTWVDESGVVVVPELLEAVRGSFEARLNRCAELSQEEGVEFRREILMGSPANQIVDYAENNGIDLIVLGHIGKTAAERILLGSVAYKVANYAHCSVFIVR